MKYIYNLVVFVVCLLIVNCVYLYFIQDAEAVPYYFPINILFIIATFFIAEFDKYHLPVIFILALIGLTSLDALYFYSDYDVNSFKRFKEAYIGATKGHFVPLILVGSLVAIPFMIIREFILMKDCRSGCKRLSQKLYLKYMIRHRIAYELKHRDSWHLKTFFFLKKRVFLLIIIGVGLYYWKIVLDVIDFLNHIIFPRGLTFKSLKSILTIFLLAGGAYLLLKIFNLVHVLVGLLREIISLVKWSFLSGVIVSLVYWFWRYATVYDEIISYVKTNDDLSSFYNSISGHLITTFLWVFCISAVLIIIIRMTQSFSTKQYDKEADPWHPINNEIQNSQKLQDAFKANLLEDNIEDILNVVEKGITDLHYQKRRMELMRGNWQSLPTLDDEKFNNQYDGTGGRQHVFSRYEVAEFIQIYAGRIFGIEESIKQCNELYNTLILKVPKHRGMTKPKDVKDFDGVNTTPMEDIGKKIDGLENTALDDL